MTALLLGAAAALGWGLYDFLIRFVSRAAGSIQGVLFVLVFGAATLGVVVLVSGEPITFQQDDFLIVAFSGISYAASLACGFRAFAIAPVSFVAPIVAAYPAFTMLWSVLNGARPTLTEWLAVGSVLIGVALVARYAGEQPAEEDLQDWPRSRATAFFFAGLASFGYAASFAAGQLATQNSSELSVTLVARLCALAAVLPFYLRAGIRLDGARSWLPILALMGIIDGLCLLAVNAAGKMDGAAYAVVLASTFVIIAVLLAVLFLRERLTMLQYLGIACVVSGIIAISGHF